MAFRIYTKTGDGGETGLYGGERVPKDHLRIEAYGTLDELNSHVGLLLAGVWARPPADDDGLARGSRGEEAALLGSVQADLFVLGSQLATPSGKTVAVRPVGEAGVAALERGIDRLDAGLPALTSFILPGGGTAACQAHVCRTVARRAERQVVRLGREEALDPAIVVYLNRLSDYFFVLARALGHWAGEPERAWHPQTQPPPAEPR